MAKKIIENIPEADWELFLNKNPRASFLQSYAYGDFYTKLNQKIWRLGLITDKGLSGICLLIKQESKLGSFIYAPGGPVCNNFESDIKFFVEKFSEIGKAEKVSFVRFDSRTLTETEESILLKNNLVQAKYYTQPQCSQILDLTKSLDEIKKNFSDSTRYNVGWVERKGVRVKESQNPSDIDIFVQLLKETAQRQHFRLHAKVDYYKNQYQALKERNLAKLYLAYGPESEGQTVLAAAVVINYGKVATYLHSASSNKNPKLRAPYLMQWKIIEDAKNSGFELYDFWGVAKDNNPKDPWFGVTEFKRGFGGEKVCYKKPFDLILAKDYYWANIIETSRLTLRRLMR